MLQAAAYDNIEAIPTRLAAILQGVSVKTLTRKNSSLRHEKKHGLRFLKNRNLGGKKQAINHSTWGTLIFGVKSFTITNYSQRGVIS